MTPDDVRDRVADIRDAAIAQLDPEQATSLEADLHHDVLLAIANGATDPAALAEAAFQTCRISFHRWSA